MSIPSLTTTPRKFRFGFHPFLPLQLPPVENFTQLFASAVQAFRALVVFFLSCAQDCCPSRHHASDCTDQRRQRSQQVAVEFDPKHISARPVGLVIPVVYVNETLARVDAHAAVATRLETKTLRLCSP